MKYLKTLESSLNNNLSLRQYLNIHVDHVETYLEFNKALIPIKEIDVTSFVEEYVTLANKNGQWIGGPINREWVDIWYKKFGFEKPNYKAWKPTFMIKIVFDDGSFCDIKFSILTKKCSGISADSGSSELRNIEADEFYKKFRDSQFGKNWAKYYYNNFYQILEPICDMPLQWDASEEE